MVCSIFENVYPSLVPTSLSVCSAVGFGVFLVYCALSCAHALLKWKAIPTLVFPISPVRPISNVFPVSRWNPAITFTWNERHRLYASSEVVGVAGLLHGPACLYVSSPEVFRQVLGLKAPFSKTADAVSSVRIMGVNVVGSDGDVWKHHRRIAAPAFSQEGYKQVWAETLRTYREMSEVEGWESRNTISIPDMDRITKKFALFIISACGFNIPLAWGDSDIDKDGQMSLHAVIANVANSIFIRWLTPKWAYYLPIERLRRVDTAYNRLDSFLHTQIAVRKNEIKMESDSGMDPLEAKRDLFNRFIASSAGEGKMGLTDQEIIGNTFVALFAGHETTAHTLVATLTLLGLYEEEQEKIYTRIVEAIGDSVPTFEDYDVLEPMILSAVYETLRLYPTLYMLPRRADEDTTLTIPRMDGSGSTEIVVPQGTEIILDIIGASYNSRYFPEVDSFKPSRFDGKLDTSLSFSWGPRSCLGRKFATTEMVCFLTLLLREWKVQVPRDERETRLQWREKFMRPTFGISMNLPSVPLKLVGRA